MENLTAERTVRDHRRILQVDIDRRTAFFNAK